MGSETTEPPHAETNPTEVPATDGPAEAEQSNGDAFNVETTHRRRINGRRHSKTLSIAPKLKYMDGLRFLEEGNPKYMFPVGSDEEVDRLTIQHYAFKYMFSGNFHAPLEEDLKRGIKVFDAGCGPGVWMLDMAAAYPNSTFTGVDVADTFPRSDWPDNCTFDLCNITMPLAFEDETFDYVFQRNMSLCFTPEEWEKAITELRRICKPGGYIELVECDHDMRSIGPNLTKVMTTLRVTLNLRNISPDSASNVHTFFTNDEHVAGDYSSFPVGWNGRLGEMFLRNSELGFRTLGPYLSRAMGLSEAEWEDLAKKCLAENSEFLTWGNVHWAVGRKFSGKKVSG